MARSPKDTQKGEDRDYQDLGRMITRAAKSERRSKAKQKALLSHLQAAQAILNETLGTASL